MKSIDRPRFALTLIEKVMRYDRFAERYKYFKSQQILMDSVFQIDLNQVSMIQKPLENRDDIMLDTYLEQMLGSDTYNEFEYAHMMRVLPEVFRLFDDEE